MMLANNNYSRSHTTSTAPFSYQQQSQSFDIDGVDSVDSESLGSSPHSTQSSLLSQYSFQSTPLPTTFAPRGNLNSANLDFKFPAATQAFEGGHGQSLGQVPDLMPSADQWLLHGQHQTPRGALRLGHHRESSLSSLGSNGPASPYNPTTSNPHIAVTDSSSDAYHDMSGGDTNYSYHSGKPLTMSDNFYTTLQSFNSTHGTGTMDAAFADGLPSLAAQQQRPRADRNLLPAPELSIGSAARSHPVSVASSIAGGDSPATPSYQEPEDDGRRRKNGFNNIPKLDRTMTDVYSDELYSPNFTITSASPPPQTHIAMSPSNDLFAQRLQAANSQHLNAVHTPVSGSSRNQSPFRHGSPLAPSLNDFSHPGNQVRLSSAQQLREKRKVEQDAKALQQQLARSVGQQQHGTPSTISPKDAMLEFNDTDDASNFPLFPVQETSNYHISQANKVVPQQQAMQGFPSTTPLQSAFNFNMPTNIQVPQQYPFVARPRQQQQATPSVSTFSRMSSAESNVSEGSNTSAQRPARANADGGTYTCTYHGCTQRFETPALLQKHKREGHRQAHALNNARAAVAPIVSTDSVLNSQAGPHRCDRINPGTGKPCGTIFSRPYDLTRHEDTIHNARKEKVRCNLCTEEKSFSRADALTRHYRVCHPDVEFPGKHRRRGGSAS